MKAEAVAACGKIHGTTPTMEGIGEKKRIDNYEKYV